MTTSMTLISLLAITNTLALSLMVYDKYLAVRGKRDRRLSEGLLFFMATCFGSIGVYTGMYLFRHKIRIWYFQIGIPLLIMQNILTAYVVVDFLLGNYLGL